MNKHDRLTLKKFADQVESWRKKAEEEYLFLRKRKAKDRANFTVTDELNTERWCSELDAFTTVLSSMISHGLIKGL